VVILARQPGIRYLFCRSRFDYFICTRFRDVLDAVFWWLDAWFESLHLETAGRIAKDCSVRPRFDGLTGWIVNCDGEFV
jgi:hypothetical protein